jgi:hypothetical protein
MTLLIRLQFVEGSLETGFSLNLKIERDNRCLIELTGSLPSNLTILPAYEQWSKNYYCGQKLRIKTTNNLQKSNCSFKDDGDNLKLEINNWLNSFEFKSLWEVILNFSAIAVNSQEEIRFIIQTDDPQIKVIPWQMWEFFERFSQSELGLSSLNYAKNHHSNFHRSKIRILAILGDSKGIDIEKDRQFLEQLPHSELLFLAETSLAEINEALFNEEGWDLLFFAGHSSSSQNLETGYLYVNQEEKLDFSTFKKAIEKALTKGLQLVILNSCDGLGIAKDLVGLNVPQMIVMREPIPDKIAHQFLKNFLDTYAHHNYSLYQAVREARNKLYAVNFEYYCLPTICQNLAEECLTWRELAKRKIFNHDLQKELGGAVPLDSPYYIERPNIEGKCYREIKQTGALIRIKGGKQMGKTSLLNRILHEAKRQRDRTILLNLQSADQETFNSLEKFTRWFCASVSRGLKLENKISQLWDQDLSCNSNATAYFEDYLLEEIDTTVTLGLDHLDRVFAYPDVAEDFLGVLRTWHEYAKRDTIWQKFRLVIAHAREVYVPLNVNRSPFNVGVSIQLSEFSDEEIQKLARIYQLSWLKAEDLTQLKTMIGGHPYLVNMALHYLSFEKMSLEQLLKEAPTESGIYAEHLRGHLITLQDNEKLLTAIKQIIASDQAIRIESKESFLLDSLGLIKRQGNNVMINCELYRQYLGNRFNLSYN